jgi:hypothetical protein
MSPIFLDTSAFVALADRRDAQHEAARRLLRSLGRKRRPLLTSTYVIDEVLTLLRMHVSHATAVAVGEVLMRTHWCRVVDVSEDTRTAAWQLFVRYADQFFSFTDCTSFALMRTMKIDEAFTFDRRDFGAAGFVALP